MTRRTDEEAETEFEVATRRLDIEIPADLKGSVLHGYRGLRDMTALLRRAAAERDQAGVGRSGESRA